MVGTGDATGRLTGFSGDTEKEYFGGLWNPYPARNMAINIVLGSSYTHSTTKLVVVLDDPYDNTPSKENEHHDILGYLGFPKTNGRIQITNASGSGNTGLTLHYTSRTQNGNAGPHEFYGIVSEYTGDVTLTNYLISPSINWTTLVTDELLAAVTTAAINATDVNNPEGVKFDCTEMYAADGRTFGDWGIKSDSIIIRAFDTEREVVPLSKKYYASVHQDLGIQAAHLEYGEVEQTNNSTGTWSFGTQRVVTDTQIDNGRSIDCGYIPFTVLQIISKSFGPNSNTETPIIVNSSNEEVPLKNWHNNLTGSNFTNVSGDHIIPKIDNPRSIRIADAIPKAILTKTGARALGSACLKIVLALENPSD